MTNVAMSDNGFQDIPMISKTDCVVDFVNPSVFPILRSMATVDRYDDSMIMNVSLGIAVIPASVKAANFNGSMVMDMKLEFGSHWSVLVIGWF